MAISAAVLPFTDLVKQGRVKHNFAAFPRMQDVRGGVIPSLDQSIVFVLAGAWYVEPLFGHTAVRHPVAAAQSFHTSVVALVEIPNHLQMGGVEHLTIFPVQPRSKIMSGETSAKLCRKNIHDIIQSPFLRMSTIHPCLEQCGIPASRHGSVGTFQYRKQITQIDRIVIKCCDIPLLHRCVIRPLTDCLVGFLISRDFGAITTCSPLITVSIREDQQSRCCCRSMGRMEML